jgi:hypothetical protein
MTQFLTIPEEFFLLTIDITNGQHVDSHNKTINIVLAAAILMDLELCNRIDSDLDKLIFKDSEPTDNPLLDNVLEELSISNLKNEIAYWLLKIAQRAGELREMLITSLVEKKILKVVDRKIFWIFSERKYPIINKQEIKEVQLRLHDLIKKDDIPDLRDAALISLLYYGDMLSTVFSLFELIRFQSKFQQLAKMELIGQSISQALEEVSIAFKLQSRSKELETLKTAQHKLDDLVEIMKTRHGVDETEDLPDWLKKGTEQYLKTLEFIEETGTNHIAFDAKTKQYKQKTSHHTFVPLEVVSSSFL